MKLLYKLVLVVSIWGLYSSLLSERNCTELDIVFTEENWKEFKTSCRLVFGRPPRIVLQTDRTGNGFPAFFFLSFHLTFVSMNRFSWMIVIQLKKRKHDSSILQILIRPDRGPSNITSIKMPAFHLKIIRKDMRRGCFFFCSFFFLFIISTMWHLQMYLNNTSLNLQLLLTT